MLQSFAAQRRDAAPSPHVAIRGAAQLGRASDIGGAGERRGDHAGECGLVQVGLKATPVG